MKRNLFDMLMITVLTVFLILLFAKSSIAQSVAINNNGTVANNSAMVDISSTTKGLLTPRMTSAQRVAIVSPAEGLLVYDSDTKGFWHYSNNLWNEIPKTAGSPFTLPFSGSAADPGKVFYIGNTNTTAGSTSIHGKSGNLNSGIAPVLNSAIWGDTYSGYGIYGSSYSGPGTYGRSMQYHGVMGSSTNSSFAGVHGSTEAANGNGVMGEITLSGKAIYGKSVGISGNAGFFESTNSSFADSVLVVKNAGIGITGFFTNINASNNKPLIQAINNGAGDGIDISQNGTGRAIFANLTNSNTGYSAVEVNTNGTGRALHATVSNANNGSPAVEVNTNGIGRALKATITNPLNTEDVVHLSNNGNGSALDASNGNSTNTNPTVNLSTYGLGQVISANIINVNSSANAINIVTNGTGQALFAKNSSANNLLPAIYGISLGSNGIHGVSNGIGVKGMSTSENLGVGVVGESAGDDIAGVGVKGISYSTNLTSGSVTGINSSTGIGVYGRSTGVDGIGIYGIAGQNATHTKAAFFTNINSTNPKPVMEITNNGNSNNSLYIHNTSATASGSIIRVMHLGGTGDFLQFHDAGLNNITTISETGNITTDGTLTVKSNKGIVRNSGSGQLRYEVVPVHASTSLSYLQTLEVTVSFATPFGATPAVSVGNITSGASGATDLLAVSISNVTTTGCKLRLTSFYPNANIGFNAYYNLIAIGQE